MITSSSIEICRPGDNRGAWPGFRLAAPPVASIVVDSLSPEGAPYRSVVGEPPAGALLIAASLLVVYLTKSAHHGYQYPKIRNFLNSVVWRYRNLLIIRGSSKVQIPITGVRLITSLLLHHVHESRKDIFLHSALPLTPPELNPGHGHQNVADIRGGNRRNNSSVRLDHLLT